MGNRLRVISLLLPTRQRPHFLERLWDSALDTTDNPNLLELVVYIDEDDDTYKELKLKRPKQVQFIYGPRKHDGHVNLSIKWNKCWEKAKGEYFMHCGDDIIFRTKGWDTAVREAIDARPKKICFTWCNDVSPDSQRNEFGTHGFIHRNWTDIIGRFVPPYFVSDYNDTWFNDVAQALHVRTYLHEHITEHMHFSLGKSPMDKNTEERLTRHNKEHPEEIYNRPDIVQERQREIEKLREFIR